MKIIQKKYKKIYILLLATLIFICVGGYLTYRYFYNTNAQDKSNTNLSKPTVSNTDKEQSEAIKSDPSNKIDTSNSDTPQNPVKPTDNKRSVVQVTASANQDSTTLYLRGGINYPVRDGQCTITMTSPSGQVITKTTSVLPSPASADCKTIQMPISDLEKGKWSFKLNYGSTEYTGESDSVSFNI